MYRSINKKHEQIADNVEVTRRLSTTDRSVIKFSSIYTFVLLLLSFRAIEDLPIRKWVFQFCLSEMFITCIGIINTNTAEP